MRILITGASGMLGKDLEKTLGSTHELILTDMVGDTRFLDVADISQVMSTISDCTPDLVIHSAAYTDVDGCERDPEKAYRVNTLGTWNVAVACQQTESAVLYISTDFVFDGTKGESYNEYDIPNPLNHYGASKLFGENHIRTLCPKHYIVRTAWLYGLHGKNFPLSIINAAKSKKELKVVADQMGTPTFTADLAMAISNLIDNPLYGTYHITNKGQCSWYDFAVKILSLMGMNDVEVKPLASEEWPSPTRRPKYSVLKHMALELQGKDDIRTWEEGLSDFISRLEV